MRSIPRSLPSKTKIRTKNGPKSLTKKELTNNKLTVFANNLKNYWPCSLMEN